MAACVMRRLLGIAFSHFSKGLRLTSCSDYATWLNEDQYGLYSTEAQCDYKMVGYVLQGYRTSTDI